MFTQIPYPVINMALTGANIKRLRIERNISVADIQSFLGLTSAQAIYQWQAGFTLPSVDHLCALSHLFGVTMNDILVLMRTPGEDSTRPGTITARASNTVPRILSFAAA